MSSRWSMCVALAFAGATSIDALAADLDAQTVALARDVLAPQVGSQPSAAATPADAAIRRRALELLQRDGLVPAGRPSVAPVARVQALANALAVGPRVGEVMTLLGAARDAVVARDDAALRKTIENVYRQLGRAVPQSSAMDQLVTRTKGAVGGEPQPTKRFTIARADHNVTVEHDIEAGLMRVEVIDKPPGGAPTRTEYIGAIASVADASGRELELRAASTDTQSFTAEQAAELRDGLNGEWRDQFGRVWVISGSGSTVSLIEQGHQPARKYDGSYELGRISARFAITRPDHIDAELPGEVRQQLAGMGLYFSVGLSYQREDDRWIGTWASQHVTYSGMTMAVQRVHDPYDTRLLLSRGGEEHVAEGAKADETI